ncbi:hypothetical protein DFS34DRAFT_583205, partial [Phlyctochytrium arcticum]
TKNPNIYVFSTFWLPRLMDNDEKLMRWTKNIALFNKQTLLVPVHSPGHWSLVAVREKRVSYHNSLDGFGVKAETVLSVIVGFLTKERARRKLPKMVYSQCSEKTPQQFNGYDCGVFVCAGMKSIAAGADLAQGVSMTQTRAQVIVDIVTAKKERK